MHKTTVGKIHLCNPRSCQFDSREFTLLKQPRFKQSIGVSWCLATEISNEWAN